MNVNTKGEIIMIKLYELAKTTVEKTFINRNGKIVTIPAGILVYPVDTKGKYYIVEFTENAEKYGYVDDYREDELEQVVTDRG